MKRSLLVLVCLLNHFLGPALCPAQSEHGWSKIGGIDEASLRNTVNDPIIAAFDLSPDGHTLAVLSFSGARVGGSLWIVLENVATGRIAAAKQIGHRVFPTGNFTPQVLYSADRRYLAVQDLSEISILNASDLSLVRTVSHPPSSTVQNPLRILSAPNAGVLACAFGSFGEFNTGPQPTPAQIKTIDVASGSQLGAFNSDDVPQAISPDGKLLAISAWQQHRAVVPLAITDTSGRVVATLDGGFSFHDAPSSDSPRGRVLGRFLGNTEIVLSPDGATDSAGHHSGNYLQLRSIESGQLQQVRIPSFGPTGELAVSGNQQTVLVASWDIPARVLRHEHWTLPSSSPELFVLNGANGLHVSSKISLSEFGLKAALLDNQAPSISGDGLTIAVAQNRGVVVLKKG